jgi:hypothetical protein
VEKDNTALLFNSISISKKSFKRVRLVDVTYG